MFKKSIAFVEFPFLKTSTIAIPACVATDVDVDLLYVLLTPSDSIIMVLVQRAMVPKWNSNGFFGNGKEIT